MSTRKEANKAREEHSDFLQKELGAHAIFVDKVPHLGGETFGVIAFYEKLPKDPPQELEIEFAGKVRKVPLRAEKLPLAELE